MSKFGAFYSATLDAFFLQILYYMKCNPLSYLSTNNKKCLHWVSTYCTVSVCEMFLGAKAQYSHECVCVCVQLLVVCVCAWRVHTYSISQLLNTCKNKARGQAQETKGVWGLNEGCFSFQHSHEQLSIPRKQAAYHIRHIHTDHSHKLMSF